MKESLTNPFLELKKDRLKKMQAMLGSLGETTVAKFVALCEINLGMSRKLTCEYLQTLKNAEFVVANGPMIRSKNAINSEQNDDMPHTHSHTLGETPKKRRKT